MSALASQITSLTIFYSTVYSRRRTKKRQRSTSQAFVQGIHRWPVNSLHKGPVTRKMFPLDDVTMWMQGMPTSLDENRALTQSRDVVLPVWEILLGNGGRKAVFSPQWKFIYVYVTGTHTVLNMFNISLDNRQNIFHVYLFIMILLMICQFQCCWLLKL